jgi:transposase
VDRRRDRRGLPHEVRFADAFHIVAWAGDALDVVRRETWNAARKGGMSLHARPQGRPLRAVEEP